MTATPAADTALIPARHRLQDAISALIDPRRIDLPTGRHTWLDSIYAELADAVYEKHALGGGTTQSASPLWIDASDALQDIDRLACAEHPQHPGFAPQERTQGRELAFEHPTVLRLQQIDARKWRPQDTEHINQFATDLERLTLRAANLLSPSKHFGLPGNPACPRCERDHIDIVRDNEKIQLPALEIVMPDRGDPYCHCKTPACDGYWLLRDWRETERLGLLLGYRPAE